MSFNLKAHIITIAVLAIFAAVILISLLALQEAGKAIDIVNEQFNQLEQITDWLKL